MKVNIITVGDEILIGQIIDTNSAWIGQQLNLVGASVTAIHSVSDSVEGIINGLDNSLKQADVVLITGGLGPTKDDITKKTIADYLGATMIFHDPTWERIQGMFKRWGRSTTPAHKQQCFMPSNATILLNKMGTAPGMWFEVDGKVIVSMPGVPYEMKYLMEFEVIPRLIEFFPGKPIAHRTILTVGEGESRIAARLEKIEQLLPPFVKLAYLPNLGNVRLRLTAIAENGEDIETALEEAAKIVVAEVAELVYGYDKVTLEEAVGQLLKEKGLTLSTAESCTGGFLAHKITKIAGSSAYYKGSVIAYANEAKQNQLGVKADTLQAHGAVSEETVKEMVVGVVKSLNTNIGIAISGIAGPTGGTPEKPVGTIWLAVGNAKNVETLKLQIGKDRLRNIQYTAVKALDMIRQFVHKYYPANKEISVLE
ncbi:MAG: competence/damage-inducible protein A [Bacteroidota bacterium]